MPPRRRSAPAPIDVDDLRARLGQGRIVRVGIARSAQFPDGSVGRVRSIGDPAVEGDEFIQVELTVNGTKDLLPFAPGDLTAPTRGTPAKSVPARSTPARTMATNGSTAPIRAVVDVPAGPPAGTVVNGQANGAAVNGLRAGGTPAPEPVDRIFFGAAPEPTSSSPEASSQKASSQKASSPAASPPEASSPEPPIRAKAARAKPAAKRRGPAVAISIGTTDTDPPQWRLEAKVGAKVVVRNGSVPPARVWELVGMLGDASLTRAVGAVLDEQRQAAQSRADALSAELDRVRAELADLPTPADAG